MDQGLDFNLLTIGRIKRSRTSPSGIGRFMTIRASRHPASWRKNSERKAQAPIADPHLAVRGWVGTRGAGEGLSEQQAIVDDVVVLEATLGVPGAPPRWDPPIQRLLQGETGGEHAGIAERARLGGGGRSATRYASIPVAGRTDRDPSRCRDRQRGASDFLEIQRRYQADFDVIGIALVADDNGGIAGDRVEQLDVGVEGECPAGQRAIVKADIRFNVAFLPKVAGRAKECDVCDAGLPVIGEADIGANPPVELVPRPHLHVVLLAPQVVEGAGSYAEAV